MAPDGKPLRVAKPIRIQGRRARYDRALFEELERRSLLSVNPVGAVDIFTSARIAGWARDADTPATSLTVRITIDGKITNISANLLRNDLVAAFGSGNYGYSFNANLAPGAHIVTVAALDSQSNFPVVLRSG